MLRTNKPKPESPHSPKHLVIHSKRMYLTQKGPKISESVEVKKIVPKRLVYQPRSMTPLRSPQSGEYKQYANTARRDFLSVRNKATENEELKGERCHLKAEIKLKLEQFLSELYEKQKKRGKVNLKKKNPARQGSWKGWEISPWDKGEEQPSEETIEFGDLDELEEVKSTISQQV